MSRTQSYLFSDALRLGNNGGVVHVWVAGKTV